uniref:Uncharacterized protein n=1 Tax=Sphaerodactylus townsendi TaxID=933632 RepID=A0ACB8FYJ5_9SAUR
MLLDSVLLSTCCPFALVKAGCRFHSVAAVTSSVTTETGRHFALDTEYVQINNKPHVMMFKLDTMRNLRCLNSLSYVEGEEKGQEGTRAVEIVESSLIPSLVLKLKTENEEIQPLLLDTLSGCLRVEAFEALATGAVRILKEKLNHPSVEIRSKAAEALMAISVPLEGKNMVFQEDVFPDLVSLLSDEDAEVRANAAGALMNAAVTTQGKYAAINAAAIETLLPLIHDEKSKVRLYSIKALTMLAEAPEGRKTLLYQVGEFQELMKDPSEAVRRAATIAVEVITWKP